MEVYQTNTSKDMEVVCKFVYFEVIICSSGVASDVEVYKTDTNKDMEVMCKFIYFEVIILTSISILTGFFCMVIFC